MPTDPAVRIANLIDQAAKKIDAHCESVVIIATAVIDGQTMSFTEELGNKFANLGAVFDFVEREKHKHNKRNNVLSLN